MFHVFLGLGKDPLHHLKVLDLRCRNGEMTSKPGHLKINLENYYINLNRPPVFRFIYICYHSIVFILQITFSHGFTY